MTCIDSVYNDTHLCSTKARDNLSNTGKNQHTVH